MFEKIKKWYEFGLNNPENALWTAEMVQQAADKCVITQQQAEEILSGL